MKSKRTFDRGYDLTEESPDGLYLPYNYEFVQLFGTDYYETVLKRIHIDQGGILCGIKTHRAPSRVLSLSPDHEYTFCLKCQRKAKDIEEGGA